MERTEKDIAKRCSNKITLFALLDFKGIIEFHVTPSVIIFKLYEAATKA